MILMSSDKADPACPFCKNTEGFYYVRNINKTEYHIMTDLPSDVGFISKALIHTTKKSKDPYLICTKCSRRFNLKLEEINDDR